MPNIAAAVRRKNGQSTTYLPSELPGAIDAMHRIQKDGRYELYILSTAPWNNPSAWSDKLL